VNEVDNGVDSAKSEIKVEGRRGHEGSAGDFSESVIKITDVDTVVMVIVGHQSARVCNDDIFACIGLFVVNIKAREGTTSQGTPRGFAIQ